MYQNQGADVAERVGFEPTDRLITDQTISSRSRYDHFDIAPYNSKPVSYFFIIPQTQKNVKLFLRFLLYMITIKTIYKAK